MSEEIGPDFKKATHEFQTTLMRWWAAETKESPMFWNSLGYGSAFRAIVSAHFEMVSRCNSAEALNYVEHHQQAIDLWMQTHQKDDLAWINEGMEKAHIALLVAEPDLVLDLAIQPDQLLKKIESHLSPSTSSI